MAKIDFDEVVKVVYGINELNKVCDHAASSCKSIDSSMVSSFSPSAASMHTKIQNNIKLYKKYI